METVLPMVWKIPIKTEIVDPDESDPTEVDTDGDGLNDGVEDANKDGIVDPNETDPNKVDAVNLICPTNMTTAACQTQEAVNSAFSAWLASARASGGCNGVLRNNNPVAPSACGGTTTVTFTYTSDCDPVTTTCEATFTVPAAPVVVTDLPKGYHSIGLPNAG